MLVQMFQMLFLTLKFTKTESHHLLFPSIFLSLSRAGTSRTFFFFFFCHQHCSLAQISLPHTHNCILVFVFASLALWTDVFAQKIWSLRPTCAPLEGSKIFSSLFVACFWTQEIPHSLLLDLIHQRFQKEITADDLKGMMAISALCAWEILQYLSLIFNEKSGGFCVGRDWQVVFVVKMR